MKAVIALLVGVGLWQAAVLVLDMPPFILPGPARTAAALWENRALLANHGVITLTEVLLGLTLGVGLGGLTALLLAAMPRVAAVLGPILVFSQAVPVFALAPVFTLWFGYGLGSKVAMALLIIYFPVTSAFLDGLRATPAPWVDQARIMGASPRRILWCVRMPAALPALLSGLRLAAVYAPIGAIIGEWVGASRGLGYLMLLANGRAKIDLMFAAILVVAAMAIGLHRAVDTLARGMEARRLR
ncbi:ABC transporter permease [Falsirhodobacter algicola]|uniref:ABC transporter permease subunit n=1 Tax=Falsirhodobacter algicola TaxID=2692330 RepID=A0A8J8MUX6_9RHOB|nr:ABC transporter permease [Falsirhodobacter algicola]QUS37171.1 ABC transporter permease subunit [Falsirhodobacter algicola]